MRCPACDKDNEAEAQQCGSCGSQLPTKSRRRGRGDSAPAVCWATDAENRLALAGYRCAIVGLVPFVGLVLGPVALVLGMLGRRRAKADPDTKGIGPATAAIVLGTLITLTNWLGLVCILVGSGVLGGS